MTEEQDKIKQKFINIKNKKEANSNTDYNIDTP